MKSPKYKINEMLVNTTKLSIAAFALAFATASIAETPTQNAAEPYVDSITQWGAWELDIEPAAGGLRQPDTQALRARDSKLRVRTNSFSALAPRARGAQSPQTPPFGGPADGIFPRPNVTPPFGGPADGIF